MYRNSYKTMKVIEMHLSEDIDLSHNKQMKTCKGICVIFSVRALIWLSTVLVMIAGWILIIAGLIYEDEIREYMPNFFTDYIHVVMFVLVDEFVPVIIGFIPNLEQCEHASTVMNHEVW